MKRNQPTNETQPPFFSYTLCANHVVEQMMMSSADLFGWDTELPKPRILQGRTQQQWLVYLHAVSWGHNESLVHAAGLYIYIQKTSPLFCGSGKQKMLSYELFFSFPPFRPAPTASFLKGTKELWRMLRKRCTNHIVFFSFFLLLRVRHFRSLKISPSKTPPPPPHTHKKKEKLIFEEKQKNALASGWTKSHSLRRYTTKIGQKKQNDLFPAILGWGALPFRKHFRQKKVYLYCGTRPIPTLGVRQILKNFLSPRARGAAHSKNFWALTLGVRQTQRIFWAPTLGVRQILRIFRAPCKYEDVNISPEALPRRTSARATRPTFLIFLQSMR